VPKPHKKAVSKTPRKPVRAVQRKPAKPKVKPKPKPPTPSKPTVPAPSTPAGVPTPAQTAGEGAVFPVLGPHSFGDAANRFGAGRAGYEHQGQDVLASEGLTVVAPLAGTIITTGYQAGGAGWYVAEHTGDGLDFFYAHCQAGSLAVTAAGRTVTAGQPLCKVGQTGDATGPHLHFEVWVGGWRVNAASKPIDPLPYLQAWDHG
jgi:murein DD-endopeptidase MepM/ murein hydrolase activator NlpD